MTINQAAGQADPTNGVAGQLHRGVQRAGHRVRRHRHHLHRHRRRAPPPPSPAGTHLQRRRHRHDRAAAPSIATIAAGRAADAAGNTNTASTSTDNTVTYDITAPDISRPFSSSTRTPNGKVDRIVASFSETPATAYSAGTTPWTLTGAPTGTSIASVSVSAAQATLTLNESTGFDTAAAGMQLALATDPNGIRDTAGNQSSFAATNVSDKAGPVPVSVTDTDGTTDGLMQAGDTLTITFSESHPLRRAFHH